MNILDIYNNYFSNKLIVDLGSDTIKIGCPNRGYILEESSLVIVEGQKIVAIGNKAKKMLGKISKTSTIIYPISESKIVDYDAAEIMLEYFLEKVNSSHKNKYYKPSPNIIVGVNSNLNKIEERNIKDLFFKLRASKVSLISQTMLSAIGEGLDIDEIECKFCLNIGSKTTEFVVISDSKIIDKKTINYGGHLINKNIINEILTKEKILISYEMAEKIKRNYFSINKNTDYDDIEIIGQDKTFNVPKNISMKMKTINRVILLSIREIINEFINLLKKKSPETIEDLYKSGVHLFGGTSKISNIDTYISRIINAETYIYRDEIPSIIKGGIKIHKGDL